jgi:outer membrane protein assembly factor BamB
MDVVYCLDAVSGLEVWRFSYACARGDYPGPRAMPIWEDGLIYTISQAGNLHCLNAADRKVVWKKEIARSKILLKRTCWTAPVLANGKTYLRNNPGQLLCLDVRK